MAQGKNVIPDLDGCCGAACRQKTVKQMQQFSLVMSLYFKVFLVLRAARWWLGRGSLAVSFNILWNRINCECHTQICLSIKQFTHLALIFVSGIHSEYDSLKEASQNMKILTKQILFSQKQTIAMFSTILILIFYLQMSYSVGWSVFGCAGYQCWELISYTFNNLQAQKIRNLKITNFHSTVSPP